MLQIYFSQSIGIEMAVFCFNHQLLKVQEKSNVNFDLTKLVTADCVAGCG